jgi:hypothetical protein
MNAISADKKWTCASQFQPPLSFFDFPNGSKAQMKINGDKQIS